MKQPSAELLVAAYSQGVFPMAHPEMDDEIYWYAPDPRALIPLDDQFHVPKRLGQTIRKRPFDLRLDTAFDEVILACAAPRAQEPSTWISTGIRQAYLDLHRRGIAHSVEAWAGGELVGGLYGVALGGFFAGESMFHKATDASKVCLVYLVEHLRARGFGLLDTQFLTPHLVKFGAYDVPKHVYEAALAKALNLKVRF